MSLDEELAGYLDSVPNRSAVVAEALREYRARELDRTLETAYREDREDAADLCAEWAAADAEDDE